MQVPESVAFSFVAGVPPLVGLYSTFFLGLITALIGGKAGMISGAAGAMAVVIKDLMADAGPLSDFSRGDRFQHLLMTVFLCGILQTLCGIFQLAKLVRLISKPCMVLSRRGYLANTWRRRGCDVDIPWRQGCGDAAAATWIFLW